VVRVDGDRDDDGTLGGVKRLKHTVEIIIIIIIIIIIVLLQCWDHPCVGSQAAMNYDVNRSSMN
jgi:hypothetical protein